jgi:multidrug efflux pump subunit AcrA (membrane-fusion protein)
MVRVAAIAALLVPCALAACRDGADAPSPPPGATTAEESAVPEFPGEVIPTNAVELYSPLISFDLLNFWGWSNSSWKLIELVEDGTRVAAGDVVAEFDGAWIQKVLQELEQQHGQVEADAGKSAAQLEAEVASLALDVRQKEIDAKKGVLDLSREPVVSANQHALNVITSEIAAFESDAARKKLIAARAKRTAETAYYRAAVEAADENWDWLKSISGRFRLRAESAGVVRHLFLPQERRKVQKGDTPSGGKPFLAIAEDEELSVRCYLPEREIAKLAPGSKLGVVVPFGDKPLSAVVRTIQYFPQELGFARGDPELPNAREIVHVVVADLVPRPAGLSTGVEIKVRLP